MTTHTNTLNESLVLRMKGGPRDGERIQVSTPNCYLGTVEDSVHKPQCAIYRGPRGASVRSYSNDVRVNGFASSVHWLQQGDRIDLPNQVSLEVEALGNASQATTCKDSLQSSPQNGELEGRFVRLESQIVGIQETAKSNEGRFAQLDGKLDSLSSQLSQLVGLVSNSVQATPPSTCETLVATPQNTTLETTEPACCEELATESTSSEICQTGSESANEPVADQGSFEVSNPVASGNALPEFDSADCQASDDGPAQFEAPMNDDEAENIIFNDVAAFVDDTEQANQTDIASACETTFECESTVDYQTDFEETFVGYDATDMDSEEEIIVGQDALTENGEFDSDEVSNEPTPDTEPNSVNNTRDEIESRMADIEAVFGRLECQEHEPATCVETESLAEDADTEEQPVESVETPILAETTVDELDQEAQATRQETETLEETNSILAELDSLDFEDIDLFGETTEEQNEPAATTENFDTAEPTEDVTQDDTSVAETAESREPSPQAVDDQPASLDSRLDRFMSKLRDEIANETEGESDDLPANDQAKSTFEELTHSQNAEAESFANPTVMLGQEDEFSPFQSATETTNEATTVATEEATTAVEVEPAPSTVAVAAAETSESEEPGDLPEGSLASQLLQAVLVDEATEPEMQPEPEVTSPVAESPAKETTEEDAQPRAGEHTSCVQEILARMQESGQWSGIPDDEADADQPSEPIESPVQSVVTQPVETSPETGEADVQDYMSRLLSRMRGGEEEAKPAKPAKVETKPEPETKAEVKTVEPAEPPVKTLKPEEFKPKQKAEKLKSFDKMRDLANDFTRSAVKKHEDRRRKALGYVQLGIAIGSLALAGYYSVLASTKMLDTQSIIGILCFGVGAVFCYRCYATLVGSDDKK